MKYTHNGTKAEDIQIAYIGGGSRGWAWTFMTDLAMEESISGTIRLYDIDREAAKRNESIGNHLMAREETKGNWTFVTADSLQEALTGADFAVISILPGTFDEMEADVHMPERLGIWQSVGDTAGPGGMIRALRSIPMFVEIAEAVRDYAPDVWVINYTNPMSLLVKTLYAVYPKIKAFGCCHEVFGTQKVLKGIFEKETGETVEDWHDVHVNVTGINHFTWFTEASCHGRDLFPMYQKYIDEHFEEGYMDGIRVKDWDWAGDVFACMHRVKMDLFRRFGAIAAAGDRHLAEFMPGDEYLKDPDTVRSWKFSLTPVSWRKEDLKNRLARSERLLNGEEEIPLQSTGEEGVLLIKALLGLTRVVSNVNLPNTALQIPNLPLDAVVETNAVFSRNSVHPIAAGPVPQPIRVLILPHVENHARILKAAEDIASGTSAAECKELVIEAFLNDPLVKGHTSSREDVAALVDDMIQATSAYLPKEWLQ
ncbi:MAG: alpha-glucosidase/alpha-galactosidase [Solobacterium sp.]|nr:alpha-glucosidase/alpha-galactosidase [Solobacterium sp.]